MDERGEPVGVHARSGIVHSIIRADGSEWAVQATLEQWRHPRFDTAPVSEMRVTQAYRALLSTPDGPKEITLHQYGADHPDVWRLRWRQRA